MTGRYVSVNESLPSNEGLKVTLTKDKHLGLAVYSDGEWIQFMPTYLGEIEYWFRNNENDDGDVLSDEMEPEPMMPMTV